MESTTLLLRLVCVACAAISALAPRLATAQVRSDIPFAPYGMDPVPPAVFYTGRWNHYGSDPVPSSVTNNENFRDVYGLDAIPETAVPTLRDLRNTLPQQALQVLTGALEGGDLQRSPSATGHESDIPQNGR